jgi:hypothetical protein
VKQQQLGDRERLTARARTQPAQYGGWFAVLTEAGLLRLPGT